MQKEETIRPDDLANTRVQKLLVRGFIKLEPETVPILLQRGMTILARNGVTVGAVAAVVLNCPQQEITYLLLGQIPPTAVYRLIPLALIERIDGEMVWLRIPSEKISALPLHQSDC